VQTRRKPLLLPGRALYDVLRPLHDVNELKSRDSWERVSRSCDATSPFFLTLETTWIGLVDMAHNVWILDCKSCDTFFTNRAMKVCVPCLSVLFSSKLSTGCPLAQTQRPTLLLRRPTHQLFGLFIQSRRSQTSSNLSPSSLPTSHLRMPHTDSLLPWMWRDHWLHDCHSRTFILPFFRRFSHTRPVCPLHFFHLYHQPCYKRTSLRISFNRSRRIKALLHPRRTWRHSL